jgi:hypothetical protein
MSITMNSSDWPDVSHEICAGTGCQRSSVFVHDFSQGPSWDRQIFLCINTTYIISISDDGAETVSKTSDSNYISTWSMARGDFM